MISDAELAALKSYCDIVSLAESFGAPPATREGRRYRTCCIWHSERTGSLVLYPDQGTYHCFGGCGNHGDVVTMVRSRLGDCEFLTAIRYLAKWSGYWPEGLTDDGGAVKPKAVPAVKPKARVTEDQRRKWNVMTPVNAKVPAPRLGTFETFLHSADRYVTPTAFWSYRSGTGQLLGCDVRYEYTRKPKDDIYRAGDQVELLAFGNQRAEVESVVEGGPITLVGGVVVPAVDLILRVKDVITWTWCKHIETGEEKWRMRAWDNPSPLYGLDQLAARPDAIVVMSEGCKAADAGAKHTGMVGMTWRGGCDTVADYDHNDWSPLAGRHLVLWPDADDNGRKAMWHVANHARRVNAASIRVVDTKDLPKGWDLADV